MTNVELHFFLHLFLIFFFSMPISALRPSRAAGPSVFWLSEVSAVYPPSPRSFRGRSCLAHFCSSSLLFVFLDSLQPPKLRRRCLKPAMLLSFKAAHGCTTTGLCARNESHACRAECRHVNQVPFLLFFFFSLLDLDTDRKTIVNNKNRTINKKVAQTES